MQCRINNTPIALASNYCIRFFHQLNHINLSYCRGIVIAAMFFSHYTQCLCGRQI